MSETTQATQETQASEAAATPAPTTTETTTEGAQSTPATTAKADEAENWEYNGDRRSVPKPFEKYVKELDRYVSKKDQARAEALKKAEEYEKLVNSDDYKAFQQSKQTQPKNDTGMLAASAQSVTQEELDAIMTGDSNVFRDVIRREAKSLVETEFKAEIEAAREAREENKRRETGEMISSFKKLHPDFSEYLDDDASYDYLVTSVKNGKSLDESYGALKKFEERAFMKAEERFKKVIEDKKNGSVVDKTVTGTPDVVYAETEDQAKRLQVELVLKGDPRQVVVKRK